MSLPSVIHTTGVVVDKTKIQISGNIPNKERIRYVHNDLPPGTQVNVELFYSVDHFHGKISSMITFSGKWEPISKS